MVHRMEKAKKVNQGHSLIIFYIKLILGSI